MRVKPLILRARADLKLKDEFERLARTGEADGLPRRGKIEPRFECRERFGAEHAVGRDAERGLDPAQALRNLWTGG